jgi:hypothetical protein
MTTPSETPKSEIAPPPQVDIRVLRGVLKNRGRRVSLQDMELAIRRGACWP